jgi:hypothetical protein
MVVPEVIDQAVTGLVVDGPGEVVQAIKQLKELHRRQVRVRFEERGRGAQRQTVNWVKANRNN